MNEDIILLRWLEPETGEKRDDIDTKGILARINQIIKTDKDLKRLDSIAKNNTIGIWRIKRAKIILGVLAGKTVEKMVVDIRVPPESIVKCQLQFAKQGFDYFKTPDRRPTTREQKVENMLLFLEAPPSLNDKMWQTLQIRYIGHDFSAKQIQFLRDFITWKPNVTRRKIVHKMCRLFKLTQHNGKPKITQATDILKRMDMDNIVTLPPKLPLPKQNSQCRHKKKQSADALFTSINKDIKLTTSDVKHLQFIPVCSKADSLLWNTAIEQYHYMKRSRLFGAQLRYLIYGDNEEPGSLTYVKSISGHKDLHWANMYNNLKRGKHFLGVMGFASASWRLRCRERYIGWSDDQREKNLKCVVNNVRFLIMPWIKTKYLASRILSGLCKQLPLDWERRYGYKPVLLETFVQHDRFKGTCYKAANWIEIGTTQGYSLSSKYKKYSAPKGIFIYPLSRDFRKDLCR